MNSIRFAINDDGKKLDLIAQIAQEPNLKSKPCAQVDI